VRKPANWHHALVFDLKLENLRSARKAKVTKLKNMLATRKPVYATYGGYRVKVTLAYGDLVYLETIKVSIDKLSLFRHTR
jgi:hypothetical protein